MSNSQPPIYCPNPQCANPANALGSKHCESCQTPLIYRYLWAIGAPAAQVAPGEWVAERYQVIAPQIWLDTYPGTLAYVPQELPDEVIPYLELYPHRLHVPTVYGFCPIGAGETSTNVLLLENAPMDQEGHLFPPLVQLWSQVSAVRQVYWLWQLLQLWTPLWKLGVASSLLSVDNLRVEGWRVRLRQFVRDGDAGTAIVTPPEPSENSSLDGTPIDGTSHPDQPAQPTLQRLAEHWFPLALGAQERVTEPLQALCEQMQQPGVRVETIAAQLNQLLLEQAAQHPLLMQVASLSDPGPQRSHNEDAYYPTLEDLRDNALSGAPLGTHWAIVCDGIGGHEGGEVASQLAVRSLRPQIQALLTELAAQPELLSPELISGQLAASIRVVNNVIATQNDTQGRESRQRMGTTLVMALQLPQLVPTPFGTGNAHELYLTHAGDSRAYWITPRYCHQLTIDDDVSSREVKLGRALYREALHRPDAGALTQALGTRDGEFLNPTTQRFIVEEDGLLLLCSDGLSDNDWVERSWADYAEPIMRGKLSLEAAVKSLVDLANTKNGHDNTSVVLVSYRVSSDRQIELFEPGISSPATTEPDLAETSKALLYDETPDPQGEPIAAKAASSGKLKRLLIGATLLVLLGSAIGLVVWSQVNPTSFQQMRERLFDRGRSNE